MRTVRGRRSVAVQANLIRGLSQLDIVFRAVHVMTRRASDSVPIHDALRKVVALHAILMGGAVRKEIERGFAQRAVLELPVVLQS